MPDNYLPSPVPSDENLPEGELPFTAFGQFGEGKMDSRVFDQDIYWVDINGKPHLLTEMSEDYLENVLVLLFEGMERFYFGALVRSTIGIIDDLFSGNPNSEVLANELGITPISEMEPAEWLASTPLVRKINKLLDQS